MNTPFARVPFLGKVSATKLLVFLLCWPLPSSASEPRKTGPALRTGVEKGTLVIGLFRRHVTRRASGTPPDQMRARQELPAVSAASVSELRSVPSRSGRQHAET